MNHRFTSIFWLSVFGMLVPSANCDAGPLFDWLFRRNRQQSVTAYSAGAAGCCGPGYCEQTVVRYVPQVAYRTVWQPVPVTTYRRTTSCNPQTGLPITCTRPCTTYTYQARRVPYTSYRPVYTRVPVTDTMRPATAPAACNGCSTGFASASSYSYGPSNSSPNYSTPGATPWRTVPERGSDNGRSYTERDYGDNVPRIQTEDRRSSEFDQGSMPRRLSRMPSTRSSYANRESYYRERSTDDGSRQKIESNRSSNTTRSILADQPIAANPRKRESFDNSIVRHRTLNRESLKPLNELDRRSDRFRTDIKPFPILDPPLNERVPRMLDLPQSEDREAKRRVRSVPAKWAANRIAWNRVVRASYDQPVEAEIQIQVRLEQDSASETVRPVKRIRFSSEDQSWQSQRPTKNRIESSADGWHSFSSPH